MLSKNSNPVLTPKKHLLVAGAISLVSFLLFIVFWKSVINYLLPDNWNKNLVMMISSLLIIPIPILVFDMLVSAECPKCNGKMFGSSFRPPYKECKKCNYLYEYNFLGED